MAKTKELYATNPFFSLLKNKHCL